MSLVEKGLPRDFSVNSLDKKLDLYSSGCLSRRVSGVTEHLVETHTSMTREIHVVVQSTVVSKLFLTLKVPHESPE